MRKTDTIKTANGINWYYEQEGGGPHLVLVPDGLGDCKMFDKPMSLLAAAGFTVTTFDMPGMSRSSSAPASTYEEVTPQKLAAYVISICDELGIEKASFWGCSSGGSTMLALVADYPERVVNAMAHEVPTYKMNELLSMLELGDEEIASMMAGMLPEHTGNAEAWYALGEEFHARLHNNYARWARGYIRTLGSSFPVDREKLRGKPLDWSVGGSTQTARFFDNIVTAAELEIPIKHIPGCHFPYITDVEAWVKYVVETTKKYVKL